MVIGEDLERKKLEREVNVTGQTGALRYYDYLKANARLKDNRRDTWHCG